MSSTVRLYGAGTIKVKTWPQLDPSLGPFLAEAVVAQEPPCSSGVLKTVDLNGLLQVLFSSRSAFFENFPLAGSRTTRGGPFLFGGRVNGLSVRSNELGPFSLGRLEAAN